MYAWSNFKKKVNEWGQVEEWVRPGDSVSQSDLGVSDEEWQDLIDSGAVREQEYPEDLPPDVSPAEYYAANPAEAQEAEAEAASGTPAKAESAPGTTQPTQAKPADTPKP